MRIRIALATAVAVIVLPAVLFALLSSPAASARVTRHVAIGHRRGVKVDMKLMSYAQAEKVAKVATYANAVAAQQQSTFFKDVAFLTYLKDVNFIKAVAMQQQAAARAQAAAAAARAQVAAAAARAQAAAVPAPAPAPAPSPAPAPAPAGGASDATSTNTPDWACIRQHESGGDYAVGNGGAYQFEYGTWRSLTGLPDPAEDYSPAVQDAAALRLFAQRGWEPWSTRYVCGL